MMARVQLPIEQFTWEFFPGQHGHSLPGSKDPPPWQSMLDELVGPAMEAVLSSSGRGGRR